MSHIPITMSYPIGFGQSNPLYGLSASTPPQRSAQSPSIATTRPSSSIHSSGSRCTGETFRRVLTVLETDQKYTIDDVEVSLDLNQTMVAELAKMLEKLDLEMLLMIKDANLHDLLALLAHLKLEFDMEFRTDEYINQVMYDCLVVVLQRRFRKDSRLSTSLLETGNSEIHVRGEYAIDSLRVSKALMETRERIRNTSP